MSRQYLLDFNVSCQARGCRSDNSTFFCVWLLSHLIHGTLALASFGNALLRSSIMLCPTEVYEFEAIFVDLRLLALGRRFGTFTFQFISTTVPLAPILEVVDMLPINSLVSLPIKNLATVLGIFGFCDLDAGVRALCCFVFIRRCFGLLV